MTTDIKFGPGVYKLFRNLDASSKY